MLPARDNPLRTERIEAVAYRFSEGDWPQHLARLEAMRFRGAIVGPQGSGKSTLLEQLHNRLDHSCYLELPHDTGMHAALLDHGHRALDEGRPVLIDGIERLSWRQRNRLLRRSRHSAGLVATLHRRGTLPTWVRCTTDAKLMNEVLADLGLAFPAIQAAGLEAFVQRRGNIREALRVLYDRLADGAWANEIAGPWPQD